MGSLGQGFSVPLIDISPFLSSTSSPESREHVIQEVRSACQQLGFFELVGHGIPVALQREVLLCAERLFNLPLEQKQAMSMSKSPGLSKRGYEAIGGQVLDKKPDSKEGFYIGVEIPPDDSRCGEFSMGPNFWPEALSDEDFREPVMRYHAEGLRVHEILLRIMAMALPYGDDVFDALMTDPVANIKLLHYPPNPASSAGEAPYIAAGTHTDFGSITILLQQPNHHGLEALHPSTKTWIPILAQEDVLIVNIGDLLLKWTKGIFKSPLHRAINVSPHHRYSVPFFYHGNLRTRLSPLDGSGYGTEETAGEHIAGKLLRSFGDIKD
ncbi:Clavaminate synthase-like protein [Cadophora sp. DSE1049]|nr:Clavaminate synthase-like protein [Cadophora sp. DSE1049]